MASPSSILSPLSSAKQNARSTLVDGVHTDTKAITRSPRASLGNGFTIYDENASPTVDICQESPCITDYVGEDTMRTENPPSSPFQETVSSEPTSLQNFPLLQNEADSLGNDNYYRQDDVDMEREPNMVEEPDLAIDATPVANTDIIVDKQVNCDIFEADNSVIHHQYTTRKVSTMTVSNENMSIVFQHDENEAIVDGVGGHAQLNYDIGDDTCLSTFSAVPNADMTLFAKLRADSPLKRLRENATSPRKAPTPSRLRDSIQESPGTNKRDYRRHGWADHSEHGSPTPGRKYPRLEETANLLDFTDQMTSVSNQCPSDPVYGSPRRLPRGSPLKAAERLRSPTKLSLLDFDIPPAPTPRSIPSITPKELESLKSSFLSQISSLKATLSGKDAEVASLKEAVTDAESRVGEALEEVRNESARREAMESEQREWERRGKEMETVLRGVKAEIVDGERERKRLQDKIEEVEKSKEHLEGRIVELQSQLSTSRPTDSQQGAILSSNPDLKTPDDVAREVQDAVEKVARELHTLYKGKHETKVAALKKSYEARWEKRVREAEKRIRDTTEENTRLKHERDTAIIDANTNPSVGDTTMLRENEQLEAEKRVLEARIKGLEQEMLSVKHDNDSLSEQLKNERAEKGDLVAVVDEWLAMQQQQQQQQHEEDTPPPPPPHAERELSISRMTSEHENETAQTPRPKSEVYEKAVYVPINNENAPPAGGIARFNNGLSGARPRPTGPTPKSSRFGMPSGHVRGNSRDEKGVSGIPSKTPLAPRSGIMSSIEKMGRGG
ncbi:hypothetical protein LOZ53_001502 [Ophidiomyces ophidiicola]|nr:hypothetical protein LOZ55_002939 [Ophidiomyces ophidiicola]KAI1985668.1 hypothetical protein LOZ51_006287 [Ophidiomyces ophidiicola]KAI1995058.1 hypothetical protein LOZ54_000729 [Ophidiomyces ophidiicola]KAI1995272.1 hypothetical protein LOZ53_001502 [Ophidiomyces ophidiicola]